MHPVGSITKSCTSVILLKLAESGYLSLDETLANVASSGSVLATNIKLYPFLKRFTIRELLNHSSGVPASLNTPVFQEIFKKNPTQCLNNRTLIKQIVIKQKPYFKPGSHHYHYTNTDYILAADVITAITKRSYCGNIKALIHQVGLNPKNYYISCGCNSPFPTWVKKRLPHGYMLSSNRWPKITMQTLAKFPHIKIPGNSLTLYDVSPLTFPDVSTAASAGGLVTTPGNLIRWYHFLLRGAYLSKYSLQELTATIPSHNSVGYGLGVTVRQLPQFHDTAISHDGSLNGFRANVIYLSVMK